MKIVFYKGYGNEICWIFGRIGEGGNLVVSW